MNLLIHMSADVVTCFGELEVELVSLGLGFGFERSEISDQVAEIFGWQSQCHRGHR